MRPEYAGILSIIIFFVIIILSSAIRILREYERGVIFRLGRLIPTKGPGLIFLVPIVDRIVRVSLRVVAMEVPSQDVITRDNVSIKVSAVIYFRVIDASKAIVEVENYLFALHNYRKPRCAVCSGNQNSMSFFLNARRSTGCCRKQWIHTRHRGE